MKIYLVYASGSKARWPSLPSDGATFATRRSTSRRTGKKMVERNLEQEFKQADKPFRIAIWYTPCG